jgi:hypothetical protein
MTRPIDRRTFLASLATALAASPVLAQFKLPGLSALAPKDSSGGEEGGDLVGRADHFEKYVTYGSRSLLSALGAVATAVGHKDEAARYAAAADTLKSGSMSSDDFKRVNPLIVDATLKPEDLRKAQIDQTTKAREQLGKSFIHFTIASVMDKKAVTTAQALLTSKPSTTEMANRMLTGAIGVAKIAKDALPNHVSTSARWLDGLGTYMRTNDVKIPTGAEARALAKAEGAPPDLVDAAFTAG